MVSNGVLDLDYLVQPDRVHRSCYTDADIFARELEAPFEYTWIYVGPRKSGETTRGLRQ
jgi:hypothetical protein